MLRCSSSSRHLLLCLFNFNQFSSLYVQTIFHVVHLADIQCIFNLYLFFVFHIWLIYMALMYILWYDFSCYIIFHVNKICEYVWLYSILFVSIEFNQTGFQLHINIHDRAWIRLAMDCWWKLGINLVLAQSWQIRENNGMFRWEVFPASQNLL